jgi:hypothetical protein
MDFERFFDAIDEADAARKEKVVEQQQLQEQGHDPLFYQGRDPVFGRAMTQGGLVPLLSNIQPAIGQVGIGVGGFDVGTRSLFRGDRRRPPLTNPDAKQLILIRRLATDEIWVRSQTEAIKIYSGGRSQLSFASLSSTGAKITDFIVLISAGTWGADLGQLDSQGYRQAALIRWDGLASKVLFRAGFSEFYSIPFFPVTFCVAKRGFWVSYGSPGSAIFPPPYPSGSFPSYWQVGKTSVQEKSCSTTTTSGGDTYALSFSSDDYGLVETLTTVSFPGNPDRAIGRGPVGLGTKKSGVRLLYDYPQDKFVYVRSGIAIGEVAPPTAGRIDSLEVSNTCFDEKFLYEGKLNPLDINEVIQSKYLIATAYQAASKVDTTLDFFEIPNSTGLTPITIDPKVLGFRSLEFQENLFAAIAFDLGERLAQGSLGPVAPDKPPTMNSGGGGI